MKKSLLGILLFTFFTANAQVGIGTNTPNTSAKLDITSTNKGFLPPRVALTGTTDVSTIASPATALLVYNTATAGVSPNNVISGYYYYNGANWVNIITSATTGVPYSGATGAVNLGAYDLTVNGLTVGLGAGTNSTSVASGQGSLRVNTTGTENIAGGFQSLYSNTTGTNNSANGAYALQGNTIGNRNTASGSYSLISNTTGTHNSAIGYTSLYSNISGGFNTASGVSSLSANTTGDFNTATGRNTLITNTTGSNNTAIGNGADVASAALTNATAIGNGAIVSASNKIQLGNTSVTSVATSGKLTTGAITLPNTDGTNGQVLSTNGSGVVGWTTSSAGVPYSGATGAVNLGAYDLTVNGNTFGRGAGSVSTSRNIAIGISTLVNNTTGQWNTAIGAYALQLNTASWNNTALGNEALSNAQTGFDNTGIGNRALFNTTGANNTSIGSTSLQANTSGSNNTGVGFATLLANTTGSNNTAIGNNADVASAALTNATAIGNGAIVSASNKIQLGNTSVTSVATSGKLTTGAITLPNIDGTSGQALSTNGSGVVGWNSYLPSLAPVVEAFGLTLSASNSGNIIHTQHTAYPVFPENLPDGFNCTLVNYSNSAGPSSTLTSTKFYSTFSGNAGSASFTIKVGGSVKVNVVTIGGIKKYYVSGDIQ